jgi:hypothetical protein
MVGMTRRGDQALLLALKASIDYFLRLSKGPLTNHFRSAAERNLHFDAGFELPTTRLVAGEFNPVSSGPLAPSSHRRALLLVTRPHSSAASSQFS